MARNEVYIDEENKVIYICTPKRDIYILEGYNKNQIVTSYKKEEIHHKILENSLKKINPAYAKRIVRHILVAIEEEKKEVEMENNPIEENARELAKMICAYVLS